MSGLRRLGLSAAGAVLMLGPVAASVSPAAGEGRFSGTFSAVAAADGLRVTLFQPGVTLTKTLVDLGGPAAQAAVNSLGESRAFASFPYPGDTAIGAPGLLRGAGNIPAPAYPLYVASDDPAVPKQEAGDGPYALRAESTDSTSKSLSNVGVRIEGLGDLGFSRSESWAVSSGDRVTAHARTETSGFSVGPLRIGHVLSVADTVLGQDGLLNRKAETTVVGAMVGNAPVEVTAGGVMVAGAAGPAADTSAVNQALQGTGITVELLPKGETASGVTSPALRITSQDKSGSAVTYVLGRASASVEGAASPTGLTDDSGATASPDAGTEPATYAGSPPPEETAVPPADGVGTDGLTTSAGAYAPSGSSFGDGAPFSTGASETAGPPSGAVSSTGAVAGGTSGGAARRAVAAAPQGADSRVAILATRALLDGGDTRSLYAAGLGGIGLCLALAGGLRFLTRAVRSGDR
ncbi:MAG TPA: hypothetical protein VGR20_11965 [Acidimicrobiia bacterium]|nr:hypothetical protein [Acidimicrobiia bacterium]